MPTIDGLYVGLMSGTSVDGIDAALVDVDTNGVKLVAACGMDWPRGIGARIQAIATAQYVDIDHLGELDRRIAMAFADAVDALLRDAGVSPRQIRAIGSHGQTLRHRPDASPPFSWQAGDPSTLAELSGITVVADFRQRDIAAGGQGAPLAPAFHEMLFASRRGHGAILNIGGIANLSIIDETGCRGFDTGPGNTLLDGLMRDHFARPYDAGGRIAASGKVIVELLEQALSDPYFALSPPKSTGPEYFDRAWLREQQRLAGSTEARAEDLAATLLELSARSIAAAFRAHGGKAEELLVCGGGTHNQRLMERLRELLSGVEIASTVVAGIDPDWMEAMAFAWLAWRSLNHLPGNLPAATGAAGARILGGIYPA